MGIKVPQITLKNKIYISKLDISLQELQTEFSYDIDGVSTSTIEIEDDFYTIGIGCLNRIQADTIVDLRITNKVSQKVEFKSTLHPAQQRTLDKFKQKDIIESGLLKAKCGWGKSFLGTKLICDSNDTTIILCHTKLLLEQWVELFKTCTDYEPGIIGDGIYAPKPISVGLYVSVNNRIQELKSSYARVIVDEAHRCGADLFSKTLNSFEAKYKNGMSATPTRRDGKHILFPDYFTNLLVEAEEYRNLIKPSVEIKKIPVKFKVLNPTKDWAKALTEVFNNTSYLDRLANDINELISDGRTVLTLGPRVEALKYLQNKIPSSSVLIGETKNRDEILQQVGKTIFCVLSTTIFDEGLSCHPLDTLVLTAPVGKNFSALEQRIGRIQREDPNKQPALIQAYWLENHILARQQNIEYLWYTAQGYPIRVL